MKVFTKLFAVIMALLMLVACFASCGETTETETEKASKETQDNTANETESVDPRQAVKDDIPEGLSFANTSDNTVTFFVRNDSDMWKYEMDVDEITDDSLWDAVYRRNKTVEERLGVEITTIGQLGAWGPHTEWFQTLRNAVNTKSGDYDTAAIYTSQGASLAIEGMYYNLLDFPNINLTKPWWNQTITKETTLFNNLFFLSGDIAVSETSGGKCLFYNKNMFEQLYNTMNVNLYDLVEAGEWTIDRMYEFVEGAWSDTNSNGVPDNGDTVGLNVGVLTSTGSVSMDTWVNALGINMTTMVDGIPQLSLYNEHSVAAFEKLQTLYARNVGTLPGQAAVNPDSTFAAGKALFDIGSLGGGAGLRDMTDPYGVLPLPKYDEDQEHYYTAPDNGVSLVVVLSSCFAEKLDMVGATLELMAAESYKQVTPVFYEVMLKSKYSNDPRDAEMYDLILTTFDYSFGFIYSAQLGGINTLFRNIAGDFAQSYEANEAKYETSLETLIDKLDELAFTISG